MVCSCCAWQIHSILWHRTLFLPSLWCDIDSVPFLLIYSVLNKESQSQSVLRKVLALGSRSRRITTADSSPCKGCQDSQKPKENTLTPSSVLLERKKPPGFTYLTPLLIYIQFLIMHEGCFAASIFKTQSKPIGKHQVWYIIIILWKGLSWWVTCDKLLPFVIWSLGLGLSPWLV